MTKNVLALDVRCDTVDLRRMLRGTARKFPPHITVIPNFRLFANDDGSTKWAKLVSRLCIMHEAVIELHGPKRIASDLVWYECDPNTSGYDLLIQNHELALDIALEIGLIENIPHFSRSSYRPHMTILWNFCASEALILPEVIRISPSGFSVYAYKDDPHLDRVSVRILTRFSRNIVQ